MHKIRGIAFYLPQFHPIPENDEWWGKGFTEWTNVRKAKPLFEGHYQPHVPADDLGYYDLRDIEVQKKQAALARQYGIYGFCYYHYWFNGKKLLETPLNNLLAHPEIDFPFCVCWANENWTRRWDGQENDIIIKQEYSDKDTLELINDLLPVFKDPRYITVDGKPIFIVYRPKELPDPKITAAIWQAEARRHGLPGLYIVRVENFDRNMPPDTFGCEAGIIFAPNWAYGGKEVRPNFFSYEEFVRRSLSENREYPFFRCVVPSWDNTPRRPDGESIALLGNTPDIYKIWLKFAAKATLSERDNPDERLVFINAWNEWGEGAHLEPDKKFGLGWLESTKEALAEAENEFNKNSEDGKSEHVIESLVKDTEMHLQITQYRRQLIERDAQIAERDARIAERDALIAERDALIAERDAQISNLTSSISWKATRPLRFAGRILRGEWHIAFSRFRAYPADRAALTHETAKQTINDSRSTRNTANTDAGQTPYSSAGGGRYKTRDFDLSHFLGKRILLVSYYCPTRYHAGGLRILDIYAILRRLNPGGQIDLYTIKRPDIDRDYSDVLKIFDNIYFSSSDRLTLAELEQLSKVPLQYDVADLQFLQAAYDIKNFRKIADKILFTPMELLLRSLLIELKCSILSPGTMNIGRLRILIWYSFNEMLAAVRSDMSVCVSDPDAAYMRKLPFCSSVLPIETGLSSMEFERELDNDYKPVSADNKQNSILYMAYFGSETNIQALDWYIANVHPLIKTGVPDYQLVVAGRGDLTRFRKYEDGNLKIVGEFESVPAVAASAKVGIAPALGGAGFRGKINQYAICGVPCVASPLAGNGLAYRNGTDIFIESDPHLFADRCISLLTDNALNKTVSSAARRVCLRNYTWESKLDEIRLAYEIQAQKEIHELPRVTAIVPSYNHSCFLAERIRSIQEQTYQNLELIVIDDCSTDDSDSVIRRMMDIKPFIYLRTPSNSGSPFGPWQQALEKATGDYIWICESDDFCEQDFAEQAVRSLKTNPDAVLYYCSSLLVSDDNKVIGHTDAYFHDIWKATRWDHDFKVKGLRELSAFQVRGQTVPNLSSAVFSADAFRAAFGSDLTDYRLTGDWLFVARVMQYGNVLFSGTAKNYYRSHTNTARNRVDSARSQAEFIIAKTAIFRISGLPVGKFAGIMGSDALRFLHEEPKWHEVFRQMLSISTTRSLRCFAMLACSVIINPSYLKEFMSRVALTRRCKSIKLNEGSDD